MKKKILIYFVSFSICQVLVPVTSFAQMSDIHKDSIYSEILKEVRPIQVVLPKNYDAGSPEKYELLFCLDGVPDFLRMELDILRGEGFVPQNIIIVGLPNTVRNGVYMRDRDFAPSGIPSLSGGADNFLSFIKEELMPYFQNKFKAKTSGHTLYGGSLAGLFVMYAFLEDAGLFTSYIAVDPSLWWNNFYLNKIALKKFNSHISLNNTLFIAGREGNYYGYMGIAELDSVLKAKAPAGLIWKCIKYSDETHYSTNFKGFWDGLKFSYGGFYASTAGYITSRKLFFKPKRGIVLKDKPFRLTCYNLLAGDYLHYTLDGTEPTLSSPRLAGEETGMILTVDSKIVIKSFCVREEYNKTDTIFIRTGKVLPAIPEPHGIIPGGLRYSYYEDEWESLSDVKKLKPVQTGIADRNFDVNKFIKQNSFAYVLEGYLKISNTGYYIFEMGSGNDYSKVIIGDNMILGDHFIPGDGESFMVPLEKGFYPIRIEYLFRKGGGDLQPVYLKIEGKEEFPLPPEMLFSRDI